MFAETFNVRGWLEDPAKWLRWSMQSLTAGKTDDARYNLQQFWTSLTTFKARAANPMDWAELYTLDGQSKEALADLYGRDIAAMIQKKADVRFWSSIVYAAKEASYNDQISRLEESKKRALAEAQDFARKAQTYYAQANYKGPQQASAGVSNAQAKLDYAAKDRLLNDQSSDAAGKGLNILTGDFLGFPVWAWLAGAAGVALLVSTGPTVVMASQAYRKATA